MGAAVRQLSLLCFTKTLEKLIMSSGVAVADDCKNYFEEIKKGKKYRYVIFYIKEEKSITVESVGERDAKYDDFLNDLQKAGDTECMILNTSISARGPRTHPRSRNFS